MKIKLLTIALAAFASSTAAHADVFPTGYTFTFHFDALQLIPEPIIQTADYISVGTSGIHPLTSILSWEMFEGLPAGTPVASGTWSGFDVPLAVIPHGTWQDGEGSFRISVLAGAQLITDVSIYLPQYNASGYTGYVYELTVAPATVPEPATSALLFFGLVAAGFWTLHSRNRTKSI